MISDDAKLVSSRHLVDIRDQVGGEETNVKSGKKNIDKFDMHGWPH
jgi:hypothetical protein